MYQLIQALLPPIASLFLTALGSGLLTTFVSIRLDLEGTSPLLIGVIGSVFYLGILIGAFASPRWAARFGYAKTLMILYGVNALAILLHAVWVDPYYWIALRFAIGVAMGGFFTVIESWFLRASRMDMRSQALSLYLICYLAALSLGQLLLNVSSVRGAGPFFLAGVLSALAIVPIGLASKDSPSDLKKTLPTRNLFHMPFFGFFGGLISGLIIACIYIQVPVYGKEIGLTIQKLSLFMAVIIFGGFALQWPMGKWADLSGRQTILGIASFGSAVLAVCIGILGAVSFPLLLILGALFGGLSFALYPLSMAYMCEGVEEEHLPAAAGKFVSSYGIGAVLGPVVASFFLIRLGSAGVFFYMAIACALLGLVPLIRKR